MTHALANRVGTGASGMRTQNPKSDIHPTKQQKKFPQAHQKNQLKKIKQKSGMPNDQHLLSS